MDARFACADDAIHRAALVAAAQLEGPTRRLEDGDTRDCPDLERTKRAVGGRGAVGGVGDVEVVGVGPAQEARVGALAIEALGSEDERLADRRALGLVKGHRVVVRDMPSLGVLGWEIEGASIVGPSVDPTVVIDLFDGGSGAVEDTELVVVAGRENLVADGERTSMDLGYLVIGRSHAGRIAGAGGR